MEPDPYRDWLKIETDRETPNYYELLGIATFSGDSASVRKAYKDRYALVRRYEAGNYGERALALMAELSVAFQCLTDEQQKSQYDQELHEALKARETRAVGGALQEIPISTPIREPNQARQPITPSPGVTAVDRGQRTDSAIQVPMGPRDLTQVDLAGFDQPLEPIHSRQMLASPSFPTRAPSKTPSHPILLPIMAVDNWLEELAGPSNRGIHLAFRACTITLPSVLMLLIMLLALQWLLPSTEVADNDGTTSPNGNEIASTTDPSDANREIGLSQSVTAGAASSKAKAADDRETSGSSATASRQTQQAAETKKNTPPISDVKSTVDDSVPADTNRKDNKRDGSPLTNSIGMNLALILAGEFMMGSPGSAPDADRDEEPAHRVRITKPFYMGSHEVTVAQFRQFVEASEYKTEPERDGDVQGWNTTRKNYDGPDRKYSWRNTGFPLTDQHPVVNVTWNDAVAFCDWLTRKEGSKYRLPTEAEWEYACRAGTNTRYQHGDDTEGLVAVGNVGDATTRAALPRTYWIKRFVSSRDDYVFTAPVGRFKANAWGLFDMHGNVWEWCHDWLDGAYYRDSPPTNPTGPSTGAQRVQRGGSWIYHPHDCRSASRGGNTPKYRSDTIGFRVIMTDTLTNVAAVPMAEDRSPTSSTISTRYLAFLLGSLVGQDWGHRHSLIRIQSDADEEGYQEAKGVLESARDLLRPLLDRATSELGLTENYWDSLHTLPANTDFETFGAAARKVGQKLKTDISENAYMSYTIGYKFLICISSLEVIAELYDTGNPLAAVKTKTDVLSTIRKLRAQAEFASFPDDFVLFITVIEKQAANINNADSATVCMERIRAKFTALAGDPGYFAAP